VRVVALEAVEGMVKYPEDEKMSPSERCKVMSGRSPARGVKIIKEAMEDNWEMAKVKNTFSSADKRNIRNIIYSKTTFSRLIVDYLPQEE
jgi:hypothetical protein